MTGAHPIVRYGTRGALASGRRSARLLGWRLGLLLFGCGSCLLGWSGYMQAKSVLTHRLIERAWRAHLGDGGIHRPWAWADTYPIGRLEIPRMGVAYVLLDGASGSSMAFGIGHIDGSSPPNGAGNCVLAGHRDRELAFLRSIRIGDTMRVRTRGAVRDYVVVNTEVVAASDLRALDPAPEDRLTLVTCFPFSGVLKSPWRYVVTCGALGTDKRHPLA